MRIQRFLGGALAMIAIVFAVVLYNTQSVRGSDHQDSPTVVSRPAADITDVFVYQSPSNSANVVLQMDVYPLVPPSQVGTVALDPSVLYQFRIAHGTYSGTTGFSAKADDTVIQFLANGSGPGQTVNVYGPAALTSGNSTSTQLVALGGTIPYNVPSPQNQAAFNNGVKAFVGPRADPFFFDLGQFLKIIPDRDAKNHPPLGNNTVPPQSATSFQGFASSTQTSGPVTSTSCLTSPSSDALTTNHFNVIALVVEIPKTMLGSAAGPVIGVYATASTASGS